jgi:hypothetical protein
LGQIEVQGFHVIRSNAFSKKGGRIFVTYYEVDSNAPSCAKIKKKRCFCEMDRKAPYLKVVVGSFWEKICWKHRENLVVPRIEGSIAGFSGI